MSHDSLQDALAMKGALSSIQEVSRSLNRTREAGNAYQRVQGQIAGISRRGVLDERFGVAGAALVAASATARTTDALATTERVGILSSVDRCTEAMRFGAFGGPLSGAGDGIAGQLGAIESSALARLSPSTRDTFDGIGTIAKANVAAFGGASLMYEQVQKQLEADGLLSAARDAMEAAGTAGLSNPALMSAGLLGSQAGLSAIQVGAVRDLTGIGERLRQSVIDASGIAAVQHTFGREAFGVTAALNAASLAAVPPALQVAAAFDQRYAAQWSAGLASTQSVIERAGLGSAAYALASQDFSSPFKGALGMRSVIDTYPFLGVAGSVREVMEKAGLGARFDSILSSPVNALMLVDSALTNAMNAVRNIAPPIVEIPDEIRRRWEIAEAFAARWEGSALAYLLSPLSAVHLYRLSTLEREAVEEALLAALERIVTEEDFASELVSALNSVPHLTSEQRGDLQAGLGHAAQGNFDRALPPLMMGMEGALWSTGRAKELIDSDRRVTSGSKKGRKAESIEMVIKVLPSEDGFSTFAIHRVFGGVGHPVRHGEATGTRREHVLYLIVLMAGWLTDSMGFPAREVLGQFLRDALLS
jgi:hypothetical protein